MWTVLYGRHWVYLDYREYRYETPHWILAFLVYAWWHCRYSLSIFPVKYIKIYRTKGNLIYLDSSRFSSGGEPWQF